MNSTITKLRPLLLIAFFILLVVAIRSGNEARGQVDITPVEQEQVNEMAIENYEAKLFELEEQAHFLEYHVEGDQGSDYKDDIERISKLLELIDQKINDYYFSANGGEEKVLVDLGYDLRELENFTNKLEEKLIAAGLL